MNYSKKLIVLVAYLSTCPRTAGRVASATPDAVTSRLDFDISQSMEKFARASEGYTSTCWSAEVSNISFRFCIAYRVLDLAILAWKLHTLFPAVLALK
ncbi:hypothetical protein CEXT_367461 [Caerostris extrusa]|uniref:Secreted protein n=1 Tax=Caerostris extrusa TaxID=172846 RepID=A0AAV4R149_CAEEX|nr:hypothetical protein CEXT_367461 [Caerostris extrusa]